MFEEQYRRDNEKLHAKETLLMELKKKQNARPPQSTAAQKKRASLVRYGAIAAAVALLVIGGVLGALLGGARSADSAVPAQAAAESAPAETGQRAAQETDSLAARAAAPESAVPTDSVRTMGSYDELYALFEQIQAQDTALYASTGGAVQETAAAEPAAADMAADAGGSSANSAQEAAQGKAACLAGDYSQTNTQVRGVDEADIVKTDGSYIYYVAGSQFNIIEAAGARTRVLSSTLLGNNDSWWAYSAEMYLAGDRLMILAQGFATVWTDSADGGYNEQREQTQALLYDVSNPSKPRELARLGQSGSYVSSRMIGDYVYIVTSQHVWNPTREQPASYVPQIMAGDTARSVAAGDILVYGEPRMSAYTVIGAVDMVNGRDYAASKAIFGGTSDLYCNQNHLLLAFGNSDERISDIAPDETGRNVRVTSSASSTKLLLFSLDSEQITLLANGVVPGTLLNQFAMDEYNEVFRLVTTVSNWTERVYTDGVDTYEYDNETYNCLYTLDDRLQILGKVEKLAQDEWIESVRFDGDVCYFVTFRQVDPLFAVDLANPKAPKVLSQLKIPGFSEYLHVYGDGLLLGLGYEADEETGQTKGVKLSMFDVSNPRDVRELTTARLDAGWTVVGSNHRAILVSAEKNLIAFPADDAYYIYRYSAADGFTQAAKVHMDGDLSSWNLRGLFIGDYFYVVGDSGLTVISMQSWEKVASLTISYG